MTHKGESTMGNRTPEKGRAPMTRRQLLRFMAGSIGASAILAACGGAAQPSGGAATSAPAAATSAPAVEATAAPAAEATAAPAAAATSAPAAGTASRPLTATFYDWIDSLHPSVKEVNKS